MFFFLLHDLLNTVVLKNGFEELEAERTERIMEAGLRIADGFLTQGMLGKLGVDLLNDVSPLLSLKQFLVEHEREKLVRMLEYGAECGVVHGLFGAKLLLRCCCNGGFQLMV